ncbi:prefoldin subunit alpha [Candidatus Marsarchaeota G2 archaeon ECH_B_SAG-F08]|uniref:Prefoldin subunit alpha n=5 Tax=Candidatus Marsarchaeota TaxID=1978152 RepID=A0A2R6AKB8_9ARCH|nr:MAG: prefoldin subunit alpha [Candidatus Marsarchaeota G1 archaeon OSP_D]PSN86805.1 MAG: prefoldin subunit alpha [Candidatus Marsarchaeota G1 archaeon BE_D]PSN88034.1 MAG: prefoldin subunit alpha [Candidatus Marsarchaeota G1 archaeon OSP_C]PSN97234.1 MAG: prefoldin subunit alpha [Candidatus Marsarchaeota G2 archaeon ECH_B_SAG-F08]PSO05951.1 MAG: prefoldin subunit alpha [Candidatus Marsarchaeota G2 archaeon ECH_B_SAG-G16]
MRVMEDQSVSNKYSLLQKLVTEYEYLSSVAQVLDEQLKLIQAAELETLTTISSIKELGEKGLQRETLVSLGSGVLAKMMLQNYDHLLVLLGQNIYAKMSVSNVLKYLNDRINLLRERSAELLKEYTLTLQRIQLLQPKIERLVQELQIAGQ